MPDLESTNWAHTPKQPVEIIVPILEEMKGTYFKLDTLHSLTGVEPQVIIDTASLHPNLIRESLIKDEQGQSLYIFNAPLSGVSDTWNALRHTTYLKSKS